MATGKKAVKNSDSSEEKQRNPILRAVFAVLGYFKNSWQELRLVRWPNRRATWGMTLAVLLFTALFLTLIVSLDAIFSQLFNLIIK